LQTGVCEPRGADGGPSSDGAPSDGPNDAPPDGPAPEGGAPDGSIPPPDGGDAGPPPDGGGSEGGITDGGGDAGSTDAASCFGTAPPTGAGLAEARIGTGQWLNQVTGNFTSISGATAVVGNYGGSLGNVAGFARTFEWNRCANAWWEVVAQVVEPASGPMDTTADDGFGSQVSLDGNILAVGASYKPLGGGGSGAAYMFTRSGPASAWSSATALTPSTGAGARFGYALAVSGTTVAVGSPLGKDPTSAVTYSGVVSIYTKGVGSQWSFRTLVLPDASDAADGSLASNDGYGYALSFDGTTLVAGAPGGYQWGSGSTKKGKAYVFTGSGATWTQTAFLQASDGATNDWFGRSVARSGNTIIVGAPNHDQPDGDGGMLGNAGAAYIFTYASGSWSQTAQLFASDGAAGRNFGFTVAAVSQTRVVVGAPGGSRLYAYTYSGGTWTQDSMYTCNGNVGYTLAVSGNLAISATPGGRLFDLVDPNLTCVP
jgi:hypothetical protein